MGLTSTASLLYTFRSDCLPGKTFVYAFAARLYCWYLSISEAYFAEHVHTDFGISEYLPPRCGHYFVDGVHNKTLLKNGCSSFTEIEEIANVSRMIQDQTKIDENGKRTPRSNTEIEGSSLQNPYDPNGTYRHKGD